MSTVHYRYKETVFISMIHMRMRVHIGVTVLISARACASGVRRSGVKRLPSAALSVR